MPILNKDMSLCISLSERPSNIGTRFHNYLYDEIGLNFIYKAFSTEDITAAIGGVRALGIRGCSVSMPFKEAVIPLVDIMEPSAVAIASVNTIVNDDGRLTASNTDYEAVAELLDRHHVDRSLSVLVHGSGGMAKAVVAAFRGAGFDDLAVLARNAEAGEALAAKYDYRAVTDHPAPGHAVIVNATPPWAWLVPVPTHSPSLATTSPPPSSCSTSSPTRPRPRSSGRPRRWESRPSRAPK